MLSDVRIPSRFLIYSVAVLSVAAAIVLRIVWWPILKTDSPFLFFFAAMSLASWYGGLRAGLLATMLGAFSVAFLNLLPLTQDGAMDTSHVLQYGLFLATGTLISLLMGKLHLAIDRSVQAERELERKVIERTAELSEANRALTVEKNKLLGILDQMPEGVYIVTPEYEVIYTNPALEREFGKPMGQKCFQYLCDSNAAVCSWCRNPQVFGGASFMTEWVSPKNSKVYDCFEAPIQVQDGVIGKLKILHDISKMRNAEKELLSRHQQIQILSSELLNAQEKERRRISRELHDELGQILTLVKLKIGFIDASLKDGQEEIRKHCSDTAAHIDHAIENMRRLSRDLSPVTVEALGITTALRRLAEECSAASGIRFTADIVPIDDNLTVHSSILLYRIIQECLNNIVKHSGARNASIAIKKDAAAIQIELKDDGRGFDPAKQYAQGSDGSGLGLTIMTERVRTLGGALAIESREGAGTRLHFSLPLRQESGGTNDGAESPVFTDSI
jgi:hypothetical protein